MNIILYPYAGFACPLPSIALNFPIFPSRSHFGPDSGIIPIFGEHSVVFQGFTITSGFDLPASIGSLNFNGRSRYAIFIGLAMLLYNAYIAPILAMTARHSFAVPSNADSRDVSVHPITKRPPNQGGVLLDGSLVNIDSTNNRQDCSWRTETPMVFWQDGAEYSG